MKKARFQIQLDSVPRDPPRPNGSKTRASTTSNSLSAPIRANSSGPCVRSPRAASSPGSCSLSKPSGRTGRTAKTLIFDEIDAGHRRKNRGIHRPEIEEPGQEPSSPVHHPSAADRLVRRHHYRIEKTVARDRTFTSVKKLDVRRTGRGDRAADGGKPDHGRLARERARDAPPQSAAAAGPPERPERETDMTKSPKSGCPVQ